MAPPRCLYHISNLFLILSVYSIVQITLSLSIFENSINLYLVECCNNFEWALHEVVPEVSFAYLAIPSIYCSLSALLIVFKISFINFVGFCGVKTAKPCFLALIQLSDEEVSCLVIVHTASVAMDFVLVPETFEKPSLKIDQLATALLIVLRVLTVINFARWVQEHANRVSLVVSKPTLINGHVWHH